MQFVTSKQRPMILGPAVERENRDRGGGVGDAMLDVPNKYLCNNAEEYGRETLWE